MAPGFSNKMEGMSKHVSSMLTKELNHYTDMVNRLNSCNYGRRPISENQENLFLEAIEQSKQKVISLSRKSILYKKYEENNQ